MERINVVAAVIYQEGQVLQHREVTVLIKMDGSSLEERLKNVKRRKRHWYVK